ncbi:ABC transporter permease [Microbacterium sp.]|uniref:ABC transporter permease n=1 Tax=Microbacterium sp. TaxID=51671 RepID=UPI002810FE73|nr:ABC transporter permease [Microbacterium sp.]
MTDTSTTRTLAIRRAGPGRAWASGALFAARRLLGLAGTMLLASFVVFGALYIAPGSPISFLTQGRSVTPEAIAQLERQYHLDEPFLVQYARWLGGVLTGDFGRSIIFNDPVSNLIGQRTSSTVLLLIVATVFVLLIGLTVGLFAGLKPGFLSESVLTVATAVMAVPGFVAAVVLMLVFSVQLGWFPTFGAGDPGLDALYHTLLPAAALSLASIAFVARLTQSAIRAELRADHVQTALSRGLAYRFVVRRHVVRNAAMPVLTVAGLTVAGLIAGSVVIEQIFQLGGVGQLLVSSVQKKDFPVVQAICLLYVAAFIVLNTLIDLAYSLLDPRVTLGKKAS